jgi:hypothetical protein
MLVIPEWAVRVVAICVVFIAATVLAIRVLRRSERGGRKRRADQAERVEELERRVGELEAGRQRVAELEERLDFAERLLARQRDASRVGPARS